MSDTPPRSLIINTPAEPNENPLPNIVYEPEDEPGPDRGSSQPDNGSDGDSDDESVPGNVHELNGIEDCDLVLDVAKFNKTFREGTPHTKRYDNATTLLKGSVGMDWFAQGTPGGDVESGLFSFSHHLDFLLAEGLPFKPIVPQNLGQISSTVFSFSRWGTPYKCHHQSSSTSDIMGRTFLYSVSDTRVFHFIVLSPPETPDPSVHKVYDPEVNSTSSCLPRHLALQLAAYILSLFQSDSLAGLGVDVTWDLGKNNTTSLTYSNLHKFQSLFMSGFRGWFSEKGPFWRAVEPRFHAYEYGRDIELPLEPEELTSTLEQTLETLFDLQNLKNLSFALASNLTVKAEDGHELGVLLDRDQIELEWTPRQLSRGVTFFPLGLNPKGGNIQAKSPPRFLYAYLDELELKLATDNDDGVVLMAGKFQAYSMTKSMLRYTAEELSVLKGYFTAAMNFDPRRATTINKTRWAKLLDAIDRDKLRKTMNPEDEEEAANQAGLPSPRPIQREMQIIDAAIKKGRIGLRWEQVYTVNVTELSGSNRNFSYLAENIVPPLLQFWPDSYLVFIQFTRVFEPQIFPGVLKSFGCLFDTILEQLQRNHTSLGQLPLGRGASEIASIMERLANLTFTGDPRVKQPTLWKFLGLDYALGECGFPHIDNNFLDVTTGAILARFWPRDPKTGKLYLGQLASLKYHFGQAEAASRSTSLELNWFGKKALNTKVSVRNIISSTIQSIYIPEMKQFVIDAAVRRIREWCHENCPLNNVLNPNRLSDADYSIQIHRRNEALAKFRASTNPFSDRTYVELLINCCPEKTRLSDDQIALNPDSQLPLGDVPRYIRSVYAASIYRALTSSQSNIQASLAAGNSAWFAALQSTVSGIPHWLRESLTTADWTAFLDRALEEHGVRIIPGSHKGRLTGLRACILRGEHEVGSLKGTPYIPPSQALGDPLTAPPGEVASQEKLCQCLVQLPLKELPPKIAKGFDLIIKHYEDGCDGEVVEFILECRRYLSLGEPVIEVAVVTALAMSLCRPLPRWNEVKPDNRRGRPLEGEWGYQAVGRCPLRWSAIFLIRLVYFLNPRLQVQKQGRLTPARWNKIAGKYFVTPAMLIRLGFLLPPPGCAKFNPKVKTLSSMSSLEAAKLSSNFRVWLRMGRLDRVLAHIFVGSVPFQKSAALGFDHEREREDIFGQDFGMSTRLQLQLVDEDTIIGDQIPEN